MVGIKTCCYRMESISVAKKADDIPGTVDSKVDKSVASVAGSNKDSTDEDVLD